LFIWSWGEVATGMEEEKKGAKLAQEKDPSLQGGEPLCCHPADLRVLVAHTDASLLETRE
jgi:hypothetical protein